MDINFFSSIYNPSISVLNIKKLCSNLTMIWWTFHWINLEISLDDGIIISWLINIPQIFPLLPTIKTRQKLLVSKKRTKTPEYQTLITSLEYKLKTWFMHYNMETLICEYKAIWTTSHDCWKQTNHSHV